MTPRRTVGSFTLKLRCVDPTPSGMTSEAHQTRPTCYARHAGIRRCPPERAGTQQPPIGIRLFISERAVENHVRAIMDKLGFV